MLSWSLKYNLREWARSSMWLIPMGFVVGAILLSQLMPWIDLHVESLPLFTYSASSAQATLSAIASGMIAFTGFVFSVLTFAIQFGSTMFTPRLVRTIATDKLTKVALGVFVATFLYALLLLAEVSPADTNYVPQYSVLFSVVLVGASIVLFLKLISTVMDTLRVGREVADVGRQGREMVEYAFTGPATSPERPTDSFRPDEEVVRAVKNPAAGGVVQAFDREGIVSAASDGGTLVELVPAVGDFVPGGAPVFLVYGEAPHLDDERLLGAVAFGDERTSRQDLLFPIRILVDIAIKALSPAVNDPTTAAQALDQIEDLILLVGSRQLPDGLHHDAQGDLRLISATPTWEEYLALALTEIRTYGAGSPQIVGRLRTLLRRALASVPEWRISAIDEQSRLLEEAVAAHEQAGA